MSSNNNAPTRVWNKRFVHLIAIEFCLQFGCFFTRPIISNYALFLGSAIAIAGFVAGLNMITALILRPVSGWMSDRFNKKTLMCAAAGVFAVASFGFSLSSSVPVLGFFCAIQGFAFAVKSVSVVAMAVLVSPKDKVGTSVGWIGLMNTIATAVGPAIGMQMVSSVSFHFCFLVSGALLSCGFILTLFFKAPITATPTPETIPSRQDTQHLFRYILGKFVYIPALPIAATMSLLSIAHGSLSALILTVQDLGYLQAGSLYFTAYAIVALASKPLAGRLSDRFGLKSVAFPGLVMASFGVALLAVKPTMWAVVLMGVLMGVGQCSAQCALQAESVRGVDPNHIGRASNTFYIGLDVGTGFGPTLSGIVLQNLGPAAMFAFNALCLIISLVLILVFLRAKKRG